MLSATSSTVVDASAVDTTELPVVMANGFRLTTTASQAPVYLNEVSTSADDVHPELIQSRSLINLNAFQADPRFAGIKGQGFSSVIIDTGIDLNHPFFGPDADSNGIADRIVYQYDFSGSNDSNASDVDGHGSNVASIVASQDATYGGMAPASNIIALKVFTDSGSGSFADVEEALQWVVANATTYNIASVNMSLGDSTNNNSPVSLYGLGDELAALAAENVIVVSAAGNDYFRFQTQGVSYPAADANSLAVSAVWDGNNGGPISWADGAVDNTTGADRITSFSQRSTTQTSIFAPGAFITGASQNGGTLTEAGTSQASPHIAGIATLAQQLAMEVLGRRLTMTEFTSLLNSTGKSIFDGDDENDNVTNTQQSYRRVDVLALGNAIWAMGPQGTDLAGTQFTATPQTLRGAGGKAIANLTLRNFGNVSASPFDVKFYLSDDATIDPATDLLLTLDPSNAFYDSAEPSAYHVTGGVPAFGSHTATVKLLVPSNDPFGTDQQYYLGMVVDADANVTEVDETNNTNRGLGLDEQSVSYSLTFANPAKITIPSSGSSTPYPSTISVSGISGLIGDVNVSLLGVTHTNPDDIDVLLVGPGGQKMVLMSDVGGSNDVNGINLVLDDQATNSLSNSGQLTSGTFKPTNIASTDTFASPAPAGPYGSTLSVFNSTVGSGTWSLYVVDDSASNSGSFAGGWSLTFALLNAAPTSPADVLLTAINEDVPKADNPGQLISSIVASSGSTDADGNVLGLAVTSVDNSRGQWQYEPSGGSWQNLTGATLSSARLLGPAYYVRFVPNADYNVDIGAAPQFGFKVWDQTVGAAGGTLDTTSGTAFSGAAAIAKESVTAVNDAPSFALAGTTVTAIENVGSVSVSAFATGMAPGPATATDEIGQSLTFLTTVAGTTGTLAFDVAPSIDLLTGTLSFSVADNTSGEAAIDVVLQDSGSNVSPNVNVSAVHEFTINVTAVNQEQVLAVDAGLTVIQSASAVITNSVLQTTDGDDAPASLLYVVTTGPLHGWLVVDGGYVVTQFSQQQIEAGAVSYRNDGAANSADSFDFTVDDGKGAASSGTFSITIRPNPGDYDENLTVDAADYVLWRKTAGVTGVMAYSGADGNGDTSIDQTDYTVWQSHFGDPIALGSGASALALNVRIAEASTAVEKAVASGAALAEPVAPEDTVQAGIAIGGDSGASRVAHVGLRHEWRGATREMINGDDALQAWLSLRGAGRRKANDETPDVGERRDCQSQDDAVDEAFAEIGIGLAATV